MYRLNHCWTVGSPWLTEQVQFESVFAGVKVRCSLRVFNFFPLYMYILSPCFQIIIPSGSMYNVNKRGTKTEHCGTPYFTLVCADNSPFTLTNRQSGIIQTRIRLFLWPRPGFSLSIKWSMVLIVALRGSKTSSNTNPSSWHYKIVCFDEVRSQIGIFHTCCFYAEVNNCCSASFSKVLHKIFGLEIGW